VRQSSAAFISSVVVLAAISVCAAEAPLTTEARAALDRATTFYRSISTRGGYLWWYSKDLKERAGENKATETQIWVQPPGTPSVGMAFLRAWQVTQENLLP
jgi:hypothetical protein